MGNQDRERVTLSGNVVDVTSGEIFEGRVIIEHGCIATIERAPAETSSYIMPGLIDAHVHIESSMLVPSEFARLAVLHGTVATVSDPHEIANVLGVAGVEFMLQNAAEVPFHFYFGAPSCVPATGFETAGATIDAAAVDALLARSEIRYLSEMMNFPGVLHGDAEVAQKLASARRHGKVIDGHAPGLRGEDAQRYIDAGISTDHECFTLEEGIDKAQRGMKIIIREGSAAKNFEALVTLIDLFPDQVMLCSDDKHPNDLVVGHINQLVARALAKGMQPLNVLRAATLNPARHYGLDIGMLQPGDPADLIVVDSLKTMQVQTTYIRGVAVAHEGRALFSTRPARAMNHFAASEKKPTDFAAPVRPHSSRVIEVYDGQIVTGEISCAPIVEDGLVQVDLSRDILKISVVNRYAESAPAVAFVTGIGLTRGAIASSVAHDSHNIISVGVSDTEIAHAVNVLMRSSGGIAAVVDGKEWVLPLPVAGLMAIEDGYTVARLYEEIDAQAKALGSKLSAPYMTLSFLALLVIPKLKLSDKGLFDGSVFQFA